MSLNGSIWASDNFSQPYQATARPTHPSVTITEAPSRSPVAFGSPSGARGSALTDTTNMTLSTAPAPSGPLLFSPEALAEAKALSEQFKSSGGARGEKMKLRGGSRGSSMTRPLPPRVPSPLKCGENRRPTTRPAAVPVTSTPYVKALFGAPKPQPRDREYTMAASQPSPKIVMNPPVPAATTEATWEDIFVKAATDRFNAKAFDKMQATAATTNTAPSVSPPAMPNPAAPPAQDLEAEKRSARAKAAQLQLDLAEESLYEESRTPKVPRAEEAVKVNVASPTVPPRLRGKSAATSTSPSAANLAIPKQIATPSAAAHQAMVEDDLDWVDKVAARKASAKAKEAEELKLKEAQAKEAEEYRAKKVEEHREKEVKANEARITAATAAKEAVTPVAGTWETENATVSATFTPLHAKHNDLAVKTKEMLADQMRAVVEAEKVKSEHKAEAATGEVVFRPKEKTVRFDSIPQVFTEPETTGEPSKKRKVEQRTVSNDTDTWGIVKSEKFSSTDTNGLSKAEVESDIVERMQERQLIMKARKLADEALQKATADLQTVEEDLDTLLERLAQV